MKRLRIAWLLVSACLWPTFARSSVSDCCEGDILLLLDSSGNKFSKLLHFLSELLRPFLLGHGQVRVGLVQVGTKPRLEFGLDTYNTQNALQEALRRTQQLRRDANTEEALRLAQRTLLNDGQAEAPPTILLWLTDGVGPGEVEGPMAALRRQGVSVLVVSTGAGNYYMLRNVVTPPMEKHLYFVDADDVIIITEDLREAIIQLIRAERLQVSHVCSHSAVLQWRPVLSGGLTSYELYYGPDPSNGTTGSAKKESERKLIIPGDFSWTELNNLQPDTIYTARLIPETNIHNIKPLNVTFRTLPELFGPVTVVVSDLGPDRLRVRWDPVQPEQVQGYQVEYGAIPSGPVRTVTLPSNQGTALLKRLQKHTEYLITVTALHSSGQQRATSIKTCTQEVIPALTDLQLTPAGRGSVHVDWQGGGEGLMGYWVNWKNEDRPSSSSSSLFLPPHSRSTLLSELGRTSRVCVSPVYETARGEGLCCTAHTCVCFSCVYADTWRPLTRLFRTAGGAVIVSGHSQTSAVIMSRAAGGILPGDGILIAGKLYSGVAITLENCLLPPERVHCTPSRAHGLPARTEQQLRSQMCEMIQSAGILLRLPQVAMATAQILFQRFFYCKSFVRHCAETVAMACLHLASKIEEEPRRVRDVLNVFHHLKHSTGNRCVSPLLLDDTYISRKSHVIKAERHVLKKLGFCVHVKHPHKMIVMFLQVLECENTGLVQMAWNYMNDSLRTDVFLRFSAETIACACIFLSARVLQIALPDQPPWFLLFGALEEDLKEISTCILSLYTLPCNLLADLQQQVEETRLTLETQCNKPVSDTPTPDLPASFSPASKAASPAESQTNHESPLSKHAIRNMCRKITNRDGRKRLSRSDERRNAHCIPSPPRRRRSRSVCSPEVSVSPGRSKSHRHRDGEVASECGRVDIHLGGDDDVIRFS